MPDEGAAENVLPTNLHKWAWDADFQLEPFKGKNSISWYEIYQENEERFSSCVFCCNGMLSKNLVPCSDTRYSLHDLASEYRVEGTFTRTLLVHVCMNTTEHYNQKV